MTAVVLLIAVEELPNELFQVGAVALVTAITSSLTATSSYYAELG